MSSLTFCIFSSSSCRSICLLREPIECGNQPPTTVTTTEWKTLQTMTHKVRCHTSTGCLIGALRTVSTWVKWAERLSAVRWAEETVLLLIWLGGWILKGCSQSGSSRVNMPSQFYGWGVLVAIDAGGQCNGPHTASFEWHLEAQDVSEYGQSTYFFLANSGPWSLFLSSRLLFSHHRNRTWQRNSTVRSQCDRFIDEKWNKKKWRPNSRKPWEKLDFNKKIMFCLDIYIAPILYFYLFDFKSIEFLHSWWSVWI